MEFKVNVTSNSLPILLHLKFMIYLVSGFPTIKLFPSKSIEDEEIIGRYSKTPKDYTGQRTAKAIVDYAIAEIPSYVHVISNDYKIRKAFTMDEFFAKETVSKVVLFTNKNQTTPLYKALSCEFHKRLIFGEVKEKESAIVEKFGIKGFPKLFVVPSSSNEAIEFKESVAEHSNNLEILRKVKKKFHEQSTIDKKLSLRFFWFNALSKESKKLIKDFKLSDMFPNLMILNPNRKVYRPHIGPFDEEGIEKFLNDIAKGRGSSYEYNFDVSVEEKIEKKVDEKKVEKDDEKVEKKDDEKVKKRDDEKIEKRDDEKVEKKDDEKVEKKDDEKVEKRDDEKVEKRDDGKTEKKVDEKIEKKDDKIEKKDEKSEKKDEKITDEKRHDEL
ncbi:13515_t:CDS:2 [Racocetra fulgida]|uniref:protein disulfide-isomerase n=1 Tax=Racocetra fulgida TaxID=60492 RepID=A0A9N9BKE7_9GLOM|nr:13515_t:CDS:2 [Racocetra fulgida]